MNSGEIMDISGQDPDDFAIRGHAGTDGATEVHGVSDAAQKARDLAADAQDSIIAYTRKEPLKALLIAVTAGALVLPLLKALARSNRD